MKLKYSSLWTMASFLIVLSVACSPLAAPTATSLPSPLPPTDEPAPLASPTTDASIPTPPRIFTHRRSRRSSLRRSTFRRRSAAVITLFRWIWLRFSMSMQSS